MNINDEVFWLIKSMSRNEKGYFKKFSLRHKSNSKFVLLFDAIEKQKEYNEDQIKKKFAKEKFVTNLRMAKSYLHHLLLQSLSLYNNDHESEMDNLLHQLKILYDRELYSQCEKFIDKGLQIAELNESFGHTIQFLLWKERVLRSQAFVNTSPESLVQLFSKVADTIEKQKNYIEYMSSSAAITLSTNKKGLVRNPDRKMQVLSFNKKLYESEKSALSKRALLHYYNYHNSNCIANFDFPKAKEYAIRMVNLFENSEGLSSGSQLMYLNSLERLFNTKGRLQEYGGMLEILEKIQSIKARTSREKTEVFFKSNVYALDYYCLTGNVDKGMQLLSKLDMAQLKSNSSLAFRNIIVLNYYMAVMNLMAEKFSAANKLLNDINNTSGEAAKQLRDDYFSWARILSLIVSYELGKEDLLEYAVKSAYRYLLKRRTLYKVEETILNFIKKEIKKAVTNQQQINMFKKLKLQLEIIIKDPFEAHSLNYFDVISWLESKITKKSFAKIIKEKASKKI